MNEQAKQYYLSQNGERKGPYTFEELKKYSLAARTFVWVEGEEGWKTAEQIEELRPLLNLSSVVQEEYRKMLVPAKTWLAESIIVTIFCCLPFGVIGIVYAVKVQTMNMEKQMDLAQKYSDKAKNWLLWGVAVGLVYYVLLLALYVLAMFYFTATIL